MQPPVTPAPKLYLYVDASFLKRLISDTAENFSGLKLKIDWKKLSVKFKATRVFIYDCIDDIKRHAESESELRARIDEQEAAMAAISELPGYFIRLGTLSGSGTRRRQKEVDVQLAVDMLMHSQNKNMEVAALLAGDRDFRPAVEALVNHGTVVHVISARRSTSKALTTSADLFHALTIDELWKLTEGPTLDPSSKYFPRDHPLVLFGEKKAEIIEFEKPLASGVFAFGKVVIARGKDQFVLRAQFDLQGELFKLPKLWMFGDFDRLKAFAELEFGSIAWSR